MASVRANALFRAARLSASATSQPLAVRHRSVLSLNRARNLATTSRLSYPRKDSQDRESINTDATEYSKSGSDDRAAGQDRAAFEPGRNDPVEEKEEAGKQADGNPLEVSPANPEVSKPRGATEGGAQSAAETSGESERKQSGGGSPGKGTKVR